MLHLLTNITPVPLHQPIIGSVRRLNATVTPELEEIIVKAMEHDPDKRFQSAGEMDS